MYSRKLCYFTTIGLFVWVGLCWLIFFFFTILGLNKYMSDTTGAAIISSAAKHRPTIFEPSGFSLWLCFTRTNVITHYLRTIMSLWSCFRKIIFSEGLNLKREMLMMLVNKSAAVLKPAGSSIVGSHAHLRESAWPHLVNLCRPEILVNHVNRHPLSVRLYF